MLSQGKLDSETDMWFGAVIWTLFQTKQGAKTKGKFTERMISQIQAAKMCFLPTIKTGHGVCTTGGGGASLGISEFLSGCPLGAFHWSFLGTYSSIYLI